MVQIQRILPPERTITADTGERQVSTPSAQGDIMRVYGQAMQGVGTMIRDTALVVEKTKAQNERDTRMAQIYQQAEQDQDISEERQRYYEEEISKIARDSSRHIKLPREKGLFELETKGASDIAKIRVGNSFIKKRANQGIVEAETYVNNKKNDFILAKTPSEKQKAIVERDIKIQELVKSGYIDPADATKQIEELNKNWAVSQVNYDIATNPEMAASLLEKKVYPNIDEEDRVKLLNISKDAILDKKRNIEKANEVNQIQNETNYLTKFSSGELSWNDIEVISDDLRKGNISERFGTAMLDVIKSKGKYNPSEADNENYPNFIEQIYKSKDQKELNSSIYNLLLDHKNISQDKMAILINGAVQRSKIIPFSYGEDGAIDQKQKAVDSGALAVTEYGKRNQLETEDIANIYEDYHKNIGEGLLPQEAYDKSIRANAIKKNPSILSIPVEGRMMIDDQGNKAIVYPDGTYKEITIVKKELSSNAVQSK